MESVDVLVIGGGISGLAAAYELYRRGVTFLLCESRPRLGGVIFTEQIDGFTVDAGPDSILVQKPAAIDLCHELGLQDRLVTPRPPRTAYVLRAGRLRPLPEASVLGIPTRLGPLVTTSLLSVAGKARMAFELLVPRRSGGEQDDESIGAFFRRRFGREAVEFIAEPLLAGIHAGDVDRLSMNALFPRLVEAERRYGSVIRSFRQLRTPRSPEGVFRSLRGGIGELVTALARALPACAIRCGARVERLETSGGAFHVHLDSGEPLHAVRVILAVPAYVAARLLAPLDADLGTDCARVRYTSTATIALAYPRRFVQHELRGTGFVVPRAEPRARILAATWVSSKWPHRAPEDDVLLRAFVGGARDEAALDRSDEELIEHAQGDLGRILRIDGAPTWTRVYRWERANAQHEVGHLQRLQRIEAGLRRRPGLSVTGSGFRGVGIPDCIADARAVAAAVSRQSTDD